MSGASTKIKRTVLSDQIFEYITEEIINERWKPGDKLPSETELAETLGVSRMSLRNGIQRCNAVGFTETRVGEGTFVCDFSMKGYFSNLYKLHIIGKNPSEINDLRYILEMGSVRIALADGIDAQDIAALEQNYAKMQKCAQENDWDAFHELDTAFHREVCGLCRNEMMTLIYDGVEYLIDDVMRENVTRSHQRAGNYDVVLLHHKELIDAIKNNDLTRYLLLMDNTRKRSRSYYQR